MRTKLLEFLKALEAAVPPLTGHHAITYCVYGSDEVGWDDRLGLHIMIAAGRHQTFFLDDGDFEKEPERLVREISNEVQRLRA